MGGDSDIRFHPWLASLAQSQMISKQLHPTWKPTVKSSLDTSKFDSYPQLKDKQDLEEAFEHLHYTDCDTNNVPVNQLVHEYLTPERTGDENTKNNANNTQTAVNIFVGSLEKFSLVSLTTLTRTGSSFLSDACC